jgi:acyl-CoA synthetase (AMP-forming)/AMP-acid ligase II
MFDELAERYEQLSRSTVWAELEKTAERLPDKVAVVDGERRRTFAEVRDAAERLDAGLSSLGLTRGSVVAVYLPNCAELVEVFYALQRMGAVIAWINPNYREHEVRFILENSGARALFLYETWYDYNCLEAALGLEGLPDLAHLVVARPREDFVSEDPRVVTLTSLQEAGARMTSSSASSP